MKKDRAIVLSGYVAEFLLSGLLFALAIVLWQSDQLASFTEKTATPWAAGGLFAASFVTWQIFIHLFTSDFGEWLQWRGADRIYNAVFITAIAVYAISTIVLIIAGQLKNKIVDLIALWSLIFSFINLYTLVKNASDLLKLHSAFKRELNDLKNRGRKE